MPEMLPFIIGSQARQCTVRCLTGIVPQNPIGNAATLIKSSGLALAVIETCVSTIAKCVSDAVDHPGELWLCPICLWLLL